MTNLDRWMCYCQDLESDPKFIEWTFYATIGAALQRRVCLDQIPHIAENRPIFANPYIIFIAPPGIGKTSAGDVATSIFKSFGGFESLESHHKRLIKIAPSSLTFQQLLRFMNNNYTLYKLPSSYHVSKDITGKAIDKYLSCPLAFLATEELGSLFGENTSDLVKFICEGYDCGDYHRETKTQGTDFIKNMCITLLGCATPDWVEEVSKNGLLKQGFMARTIFIYAERKAKRVTYRRFDRPEQVAAFDALREHIKKLTQLYGPVRFSPEARAWIDNWYLNGGDEPRNNSKVLVDYYARKKVHLWKLAMLVHYSDHCGSEIELSSVLRALHVLEDAEPDMHKALMGQASTNPGFKVAQMIEDKLINGSIKAGHPAGMIKEGVLFMHVYEHCTNGRATFDDALQFLKSTGRIKEGMEAGKPAYQAIIKREEHTK